MEYQTHKNAEMPGIFVYSFCLIFISKIGEKLEKKPHWVSCIIYYPDFWHWAILGLEAISDLNILSGETSFSVLRMAPEFYEFVSNMQIESHNLRKSLTFPELLLMT